MPASPADDRCAATTYAAANTTENLAGLPAFAETDSVACGGFTEGSPSSVPAGLNTLAAPASVTRPDQVVSATQMFYDDPSFSTTFPQSAAPTTGNVTMTRGRMLDAYDAAGRCPSSPRRRGRSTSPTPLPPAWLSNIDISLTSR